MLNDERNPRVVKLIIKKPLDFDVQKKFVFKLYLVNENENEKSNKVNNN